MIGNQLKFIGGNYWSFERDTNDKYNLILDGLLTNIKRILERRIGKRIYSANSTNITKQEAIFVPPYFSFLDAIRGLIYLRFGMIHKATDYT